MVLKLKLNSGISSGVRGTICSNFYVNYFASMLMSLITIMSMDIHKNAVNAVKMIK